MSTIDYSWNRPFKDVYKKSIEPIRQIYEYTKFDEVRIHLEGKAKFDMHLFDGEINYIKANIEKVEFCSQDSNVIRASYQDIKDAITKQLLQFNSANFELEEILNRMLSAKNACSKYSNQYNLNKIFLQHLTPLYTIVIAENIVDLNEVQFLKIIDDEIISRIRYEMDLRSQLWDELMQSYNSNIEAILKLYEPSYSGNDADKKILQKLFIEFVAIIQRKKLITDTSVLQAIERKMKKQLGLDSDKYKAAKSEFNTRGRFKQLINLSDELNALNGR